MAWKPQRVEPEQTGLHTYNLDNIYDIAMLYNQGISVSFCLFRLFCSLGVKITAESLMYIILTKTCSEIADFSAKYAICFDVKKDTNRIL